MWELVNDGVLKLHKVPGTDTVVNALTKSNPFPVLEKHRKYLRLWGSGVPFSAKVLVTVPVWRGVAVFKLEMG